MFAFAAPAVGALFLCLVSPPWAMAQTTRLIENVSALEPLPLGLVEAMRVAEQRSQALQSQQSRSDAARQRAVAAGQRPDPVLRLGLDNVPVQGGTSQLLTREPTTARSIGIAQALPSATKREARRERFEQEALLALSQRELQRSNVRQATALAWWTVRAEVQRQAVLVAQRDEAGLTVAAAEAAYRAGRGPQTEVFVARSALVSLEDRRLAAQTQLESARSALRRWTGARGDATLSEAPALDQSPLSEPAPAWQTQDPQLQASAARESTAVAMAALAREERVPDWTVDVRFAQLGSRFDNKVSLGFSVPLRWDTANRQDREVAARLAEVEQAQAETEELQRSRQADVERWQHGWHLGLQRLRLLDGQALPLAQSRSQAALGAYRAGSGSLQSVLQARQAELALQIERVQIELDAAADWTRLATFNLPPEVSP
jgi:cobalt-zinc-cadmium efflux system outer membrane protein